MYEVSTSPPDPTPVKMEPAGDFQALLAREMASLRAEMDRKRAEDREEIIQKMEDDRDTALDALRV